jgi:hypothetical protein
MANLFDVPSPKGPYGPPDVSAKLQQFLGGLPEDYFKGTQMRRTLELQKPYDVPTGPGGQIDYAKYLRDITQKEGIAGAEKVVPLLAGMDVNRIIYQGLAGGGDTGAQPRVGAPAQPQGQDPRMLQDAAQPQTGAGAGNAYSISDIVNRSGLVSDPVRTANMIGAQMRINPATPLSREQAGQVSAALENQFGETPGVPEAPGRASQFPGPGTASTANDTAPMVPRRVQTVQAPSMAGQPGFPGQPDRTPVGSEAEARRLLMQAQYLNAMSSQQFANPATAKAAQEQAKQFTERARQIFESLGKYGEPTGTQKEAGGIPVPEFERMKTLSAEMGKKQAAVIGEYIDAGRSAQKRIQSLDTIGDALKRGGGNITTGPFAEHVLHAKQAISSAFNIPLAGVPEAEVAQKTGFALASQAVKEITNRPTQREFQAAIQNNPGLLLSKKGSFLMIDVMKQAARQDVELTKKAMRRENWDNWPDVVDKFYQDYPLKSPFDHSKNLGMDDLVAIGGAAPRRSPAAPALPPGWSVREH